MSERWEKMGHYPLAVIEPYADPEDPVTMDYTVTGWSPILSEQATYEDPVIIGESERYNGQDSGTDPGTTVIFSTSDHDTADGEGAREVEISGLDGEFNTRWARVKLRGTEPVDANLRLVRCYSPMLFDAGPAGAPVGNLIVQQQSDAGGDVSNQQTPVIFGSIAPLESCGGPCGFTVPAGMVAEIKDVRLSFLNTDGNIFSVIVDLVARKHGGTVFKLLDRHVHDRDRGDGKIKFKSILLPEKSDVILRSPSVIGTVGVSARINYTLTNSAGDSVRFSV